MEIHGEVLARALLAEGFVFDGARVPLLGPQGIFKPRVLPEVPLSITTVHGGPYADSWVGGLLRYAYRGTDPNHPDNRGLRLAMQRQTRLVYFFGIRPGSYVPAFPVYIVADRRSDLFFDVAVDDIQQLAAGNRVESGVLDDQALGGRAGSCFWGGSRVDFAL